MTPSRSRPFVPDPSGRPAPGPARLGLLVAILALAGAGSAAAQEAGATGFTVEHLLNTENVDLAALSPDGRWAVVTVASLRDRLGTDNHRYGDPTYVRPAVVEPLVVDTRSGEQRRLVDGKVWARAFAWSPDARRLAYLTEAGGGYEYRVWEREENRTRAIALPADLAPAPTARLDPVWTPDGRSLVLPLRAADWEARAAAAFTAQVEGPIVIRSSSEPFLAWEAVRRLGGLHVLAAYDLDSEQVRTILPETPLLDVDLTADGRLLYTEDITEGTDYDRIFGTDGRVMVRALDAGAPRVVIDDTGEIGRIVWADDHLHYAWAEEGDLWLGVVGDTVPRRLTGSDADSEGGGDTVEDGEEEPRYSPVTLSARGERLVASSEGDYIVVDTESGQVTPLLTLDEDDELGPEVRIVGWLADGDAVLVQRESRTEWFRQLIRYGVAGDSTVLMGTRRLLESVELSRDGSTVVFEGAQGNHPTDLYAADAARGDVRRLTHANLALDPALLARTELVQYLDADGDRLHGVLYYPLGYEPGTAYPTILYVYEDFFDDGFNGFVNVMTSNGYAVMRPSVDLEPGFPGEAWLKGVTAAANELIRRGIADPDRLAVQGTSYGGYAVNLLVTQTDRFAAAVNVSGKVNMVSFYTDSPRLATRNIHAPENSQDRIGATLWEQPQKYVAHSAIMFADRIDTPMLLIGGDQDHNVPNRQLMEMYYALRRLEKDVTWVTYVHGGHGMPTTSSELVHDYYRRILDFYGEHLHDTEGGSGDD